VSSLTLGKFRVKIGFNLEKSFNNLSHPKNSGMVGGSESFSLLSFLPQVFQFPPTITQQLKT